MDFANQIIFISSSLLVLSVFVGFASSRIGAPLLLTFLTVGVLVGEDGPGGIIFNDMDVAYLIGSLSLAIILFDGGLRTPFALFRPVLAPALALSTLGVLITAGITGAFAAWLLEVPLLHGLLFGAILASTDAAAVFLLLNQKGAELTVRMRALLEVESGTNDPMAVLLTIGLVEMLMMPQTHHISGFIAFFVQQMVIGGATGYVGGKLLVWMMNSSRLAAGLYPLVALSGGLLVFSGTQLLEGSGFLAVYLTGLVMGNAVFSYKDFTTRFCDGIAWLCQIVMFLMIGLLVTPSQLLPQLLPALLIALVLIFLARPLASFVCLQPYHFNWREKTFISWVGLRGALPIFLALIPALSGVDDSRTYFNIAFVVVVLSLVLQGWTVFSVARILRLEATPSDDDKKVE